MKREKRLTKREKKLAGQGGDGHTHDHQHIHCVACGRHLDQGEFSDSPPTASIIACEHGSKFPVCTSCVAQGQKLLDEHDRTGQPVKTVGAWH